MRYGDLSNKPAPKLVVVFEGAVGILPKESEKKFHKATSKHRWWEAINYFELQDLMMRKLLDLIHRESYNVVIMTWMGKDAAEEIKNLMDEENIPVHDVYNSTPEKLARDLAYNPDILAVYDPDPEHVFTYGSKGVVLVDPVQLGRF